MRGTILSRKADRERGASAVLVAASMLMLIGFAALAVDGGIVFDDRRQQQSAADVGSLAALQFARTTIASSLAACNAETGIDYAACRGAEETIEIVNDNLNNRFALADWAACSDPNKPAEYTQASTLSPCINFTVNLKKVRVQLPTTAVDTSFAGAIGFNSVNVSAFAEAGADLDQSAAITPFAVGPTGAGSSHACLFANPAIVLNVDPCNGPTEGNFGYLDVSLYGNDTTGTAQTCGAAFLMQKLSANIILGTDHPLEEEWKIPGSIVNDVANCPNWGTPVDELMTQTGNSTTGLENGLFYGNASPAFEGKLLCKGTLSSDTSGEYAPYKLESLRCEDVLNAYPEFLDHTPLWDYIIVAANSEVIGGACAPGGGAIKNRAEMVACLDGWKAWSVINGPHTMSLFLDDLEYAPRFAAIPILDTDPSSGAGNYLINDILPMYFETLLVKCNANSCQFVHSPGEPFTGSVDPCPIPLTDTDSSCGWTAVGTKKVSALTGFILTEDMLGTVHRENFPTRSGTIVYNLIK